MEICRICLIETCVYTYLNPFENKLSSCIPEMKIGIVHNPIICNCCLVALNTSYEFHMQCLKNERQICNYIKNNNIYGFVDLKKLTVDLSTKFESDVIDLEVDTQTQVEYVKEESNEVEEEIVIKVESSITDGDDYIDTNSICAKNNECLVENNFCENCNITFELKSKFISHMKEVHTLGSQLRCLHCEDIFPTHSQFENHMSIHGGKPEHQCQICPKSFYFKRSLNRHVRRHMEAGEKNFLCTECGKGFPFRCRLVIHLRTHSGERPFVCNVCKKYFISKDKLSQHELTHTGTKNYKCKFCKNRFFDRGALLKHERIHGGNKRYFCQVCNLGYFQKSPLKVHLRTHTGEKPYSCQICGKAFATLTGLKLHLRTHTGEKPFQCEICSKCFSDKSGLNRHAKIHS